MKTYESILNALNNNKPELAKAYLMENIREEGAKKAGAKTTELSLVKRLMKINTDEGRTSLCSDNPFTVEGTYYHCLLTNYYAFCNTTQNYGYDLPEENNFSACVKSAVTGFITGTTVAEPASIDINDVAGAAAVLKADKGKSGRFGYIFHALKDGSLVAVNPIYLLDCLKFVGADARVLVSTPKSAIYLENADKSRVAIVMPVRVARTEDERWQFASCLK